MPDLDNSTFAAQIAYLLDTESFEKAESLVLAKLDQDPNDLYNFILLGDVFLRQGRSMEAQIFYEKAMDSPDTKQIAKNKLAKIVQYIQQLKLTPQEIATEFITGKISQQEFLILLFMIRESDHKMELIDLIRHDAMIDEGNWRLFWRLAREAMLHEQLEAVDDLCNKILSVKSDFWFARELPKHARGYYAQAGQDEFIEKFFALHPPQNKVFVEVGAFDGVHYSNVRRLFAKAGWSGICIEPVEENFKKLCEAYKDSSVICIQAAVSDHNGESILNVSEFPHLPEWGSEASSLVSTEKRKWDKYRPVWKEQKVVLRTLDSILEDSGLNHIDFLSIDTKGNDLAALSSLDLTKFGPKLIVIEYGDAAAQIKKYAEENGYQVIFDNRQEFFLQPSRDISQKTTIPPGYPIPGYGLKKIVGLVTGNSAGGGNILKLFKFLTPVVDSIFFLDTNAGKQSASLNETLETFYNIQKIVYPASAEYDESANKNQLLGVGRELGGTHFVIIDEGELFTSNLLENNLLKNSIMELEPGDSLTLNRIMVCNGMEQFKFDDAPGFWNYKTTIFADDGKCMYEPEIIHAPKIPRSLHGHKYVLEGTQYGILDFSALNPEQFALGIAWYQMLERIKRPTKSAQEIVMRYTEKTSLTGPPMQATKPEWFSNYSEFDPADFTGVDNYKITQMLYWFTEYGESFFKDLDIWKINWSEIRAKYSITGKGELKTELEQKTSIADLQSNAGIDELLAQAEQLLHTKNPAEAEHLLREVLSKEPENVTALNNLAVVKIMQDEFDAAQVILDRLLQISPNDENARENLNFLRKVRKL